MALVDPSLGPAASWEFEAEVLVLHHSTTLAAGYSPVMHIGVCSQSASVTSMTALDGTPVSALRTGDRALLRCRFLYRPEYVRCGDTLLFREGRAKGVGRIRGVFASKAPLAAVPTHTAGTTSTSAVVGGAGTGTVAAVAAAE